MIFYQEANSQGNYNYNLRVYKNCEWFLHFHKNFEFLCVLDGELEVTVDEKTQTLTKDAFAVIFPNEVHAFHTKENSLVWVGVFSKEFIADFAAMAAGKKSDRISFYCSKEELSYLKNALLSEENRDLLSLKSSLYMISSRFLKEVELLEKEKVDDDLAHRIIEFTEKNFREQITMQDMAKSLGFEYHYFSRCFKNIFHINFKTFLNQYRFEYAKDLILNTDMTMTEISNISGFGSLRNFNRIYKEIAGITPHEQKRGTKNET